ncbi:MAG: GNAT family N-acetyltransferase [Chloroflexota bacterium]
MPSFELRSALEFSVPALADLLTRGFEAYFVPIQINDVALLTMIRRDSVDIPSSRVLLVDGKPSGVALIARRGWTSRLAAMGFVKAARGLGAGTWAMQKLIEEARQREDREMLLEVIEQNEAGVRLYQKSGFAIVRRLVGFSFANPQASFEDALQEINLRDAGQAVARHGLADLPWQLSGESLAQLTPPARAYCLGPAYAVLTNVQAKDVTLFSLLVEQGARGKGNAMRLLSALFSAFPEKTWHIPALFPEEIAGFFEKAGFTREKLSQYQMALRLQS